MFVLSCFVAPPAVAGGPTSVLLTSPATTRATAFYNDGEGSVYERLLSLLTRSTGGGRAERPSSVSELPTENGQVNVAWMAHEIAPWRVDRVYPQPKGVLWVETIEDVQTMQSAWHKAERPKELRALLKELGLMSGPGDAGQEQSGEGSAAEGTGGAASDATGGGEQAPARSLERTAASSDAATAATGWWWSLPGLAAGALLALLVARPWAARLSQPRIRRRGTLGDPGPRRQLLDG